MLLDTQDRTVTSSGVMQVARATIKTSPKIFNFFADQTYANKPRAICRELVANAFDSHVMAGKPELSVEVWLPTILDPVFRVRDHGLGMAHDFMMTSFMCYADGSTKDQSNLAIGGFGIGSKSPFAYVDQYTITSRFDGLESVYSIFKDDEGIPAIGLLGQRATTEPNGVEVSFPVKPDDFPTFEEAAFEALRYFDPLPEIKNAIEGSFNPPEYVSRGKTWGMRPQQGPLNIIMGGIMYPVNATNLSYKFPADSAARKLLEYGLDLRVPIGTCSVALSREALSYDDRTINAIREACENVIEEVAESFSTMFDKFDSAWEAAAALHAEVGDSAYHARAKFLSEHAKWKGAELTKNLDYPNLGKRMGFDKTVYESRGYSVGSIASCYDRRGRRNSIKPAKVDWHGADKYGFTPGKIAYFVIDDLPQKPGSKTARKLKEFADDHGKHMLVVRPDTDGLVVPTIEQIVEGFGNPPEDAIVLTSSLPEPIMERGYSKKNADRPKVRMFTYSGVYQTHNWNQPALRIHPDRAGVTEIPYLDQPNAGILVVMENFIPTETLSEAIDVGLMNWSELRFVNGADAKKLSKGNWVPFSTEFERRKKAAIAAYPELPQRLAMSNTPELRPAFDFFRRNPDVDFSSRKPFGQMFKLYQRYAADLTAAEQKLARYVEAKLPRGVKPEELLNNLKTKQPKALRLMGLLPSHRTLDEEDLKLFQENL